MEAVLNFVINEIFGQGAIFIALIACIGLVLQKKPFSEIVRGTVMTAVGFFVLSTGTGLITGNSIDGISAAFNTVMPQAIPSTTVDIGAEYGTEIIAACRVLRHQCACRALHQVEVHLPDGSHALLVPVRLHRRGR